MNRAALRTGLILFALFAAFVLLVKGCSLYGFYRTPKDPEARFGIFEVEKGATFTDVARKLKEEGIVSDAERFALLGRLLGADKDIKAGEYWLSPANSPGEILQALEKGKVYLRRFTVPEGANVYDVEDILKETGFPAHEKFLEAAFNEKFLESLGIPGPSAEGYLFPETYRMPRSNSARGIIRFMAKEFKKRFSEKLAAASERLGLTPHEIVTLASLVEKETADKEEKPLVAGVFMNRLRKGMLLQCDPTVIYGLKLFGKRLYNKHLKTENPYNTYTTEGLPPGPIANPGAGSLKAAMSPADVDYLFFVSRGDGTHHFSETNHQHQEAVNLYQR